MKLLKRFFCRIGWHGPILHTSHDGCSVHAQCKWCDFQGLIDSNGNLF